MASLIPGYEYDIFISYRQKDNKHDGWVTEFVENLKGELESTFKEEISVYFDINPHDGLLDTYDVDASLKDKLKCLVFIPVISRTYCDPKSFAWEHEFKAFVEQASKDGFGLKVKLPNGNVTNRVLPIRIHELDASDSHECEAILGNVLRGIDFIYKEPGVNKPLTAELNSTKYNIQINKVANAIREITAALKQDDLVFEEPAKLRTGTSIAPSKRTKIIPVAVAVAALIISGSFFIPRLLKHDNQIEKSIAVLPFINDSPDTVNKYFSNGLMDEIIIKLQTIKEFKVPGRTSVEQYRNTIKRIPLIARELKVNYIVEGSCQQYGNTLRLRIQLLDGAKDRHMWGESYEQVIKSPEDLFRIQTRIAESIAAELRAVVSPDEKRRIEKIPTSNLQAYQDYHLGKEEQLKFWNDNTNVEALNKAEVSFKEALNHDPDFALAYAALALVYYNKNYIRDYLSGNFLDSVRILADKALSIDDQLTDAYCLKGIYYAENGDSMRANKEYDRAIECNPNNWMAYYSKSQVYLYYDLVRAIVNLKKAESLNQGPELPLILMGQEYCYLFSGFIDKAHYTAEKWLKYSRDSITYLWILGSLEYVQTNYQKAIEYFTEGLKIDSGSLLCIGELGFAYAMAEDFKDALYYDEKYIKGIEPLEQMNIQGILRVGYSYMKNGLMSEADKYFDMQIEYCNKAIESNRIYALNGSAYYDLACVNALRGNKKEAYKNLNIFNRQKIIPFALVYFIKNDPMLDNLRNDPEFQQIVRDVEAKYESEHERVGKWLKENDVL